MAVSDIALVPEYFHISDDNRLLFGGLATYSGQHPANIKKELYNKLLNIFPQAKDIGFEYEWGGFMGIGANRFPQVGQVKDNVFYAQAYAGHGIAASHVSARLIADKISGEVDRFDFIADITHQQFMGWNFMKKSLFAIKMAVKKLKSK